MRRLTALFFLMFCSLTWATHQRIRLPIPQGWGQPQYDFAKNPLTEEGVLLGRHLFYDPILSRDGKISCASCHSQYTAFTHVDHDLSHGIDDRVGRRNSPALMNLAWHSSFMWDGAVNHLDVQSLAPITHRDEMDETLANVVRKINETPRYRPLFAAVFGDSTATGERVLKSISQFMLTLISAESKYDSVARREAEYTPQEARGYALFLQNCNSCHREPLFTNLEFENNGLPIDTTLRDSGRALVTQRPQDALKFKVPTLRNVQFSYPYMHDGRFRRLHDVLNHYTTGIHQSPTLALQLQTPLQLSSEEKVDIIAFLRCLTDRKFLFDPRFGYPK